jgi:hypothetical protein
MMAACTARHTKAGRTSKTQGRVQTVAVRLGEVVGTASLCRDYLEESHGQEWI